ncbi:hypothetical protein MBLNU459_g0516t2 [Dothideomycetes sp. NU459]
MSSLARDPFMSGGPGGLSQLQLNGLSPTLDRRSNDKRNAPQLAASTSESSYGGVDSRHSSSTSIILRKLPRNVGSDALRSMLLFAQDLVDIKLVESDAAEDKNFRSAVAVFKSPTGAREAQDKLNGKPNTTGDANMIVQILSDVPDSSLASRRGTMDGASGRHQSDSAASSSSSNNTLSRQSSRYSSSFHAMDKVSPPLASPTGAPKELPIPESSSFQRDLFSPQSPVANRLSDRHRPSGKLLISGDDGDDDTGHLISNPLEFAMNGHYPVNRRTTVPTLPTAQFGALSLSTNMANGHVAAPSNSGITSPQAMPALLSPSITSPNSIPNASPNGSYPQMYRNLPPANPADQHPPCNTLYVGNLPGNTNEDELKALFSKQRGYKRLCFRHKGNGPMCFVEFEDIPCAAMTLNSLYGHPLSNSVRGGIRLSFSKNPLGVRTGQMNGVGPSSPMSPQAMSSGFGNALGAPPGFTTANGPPPGLMPPGVRSPTSFGPPAPVQQDGGFGRGFGNVVNQAHRKNLQGQSIQQPSGGYANMSNNLGFSSPPPNGGYGDSHYTGFSSEGGFDSMGHNADYAVPLRR